MWHESGEFSSTSVLRKLPPVDYLPPPTFQSVLNCICQVYQSKVEYAIVGSSGGLLLLQTVTALKWQNGSRFISNNHVISCDCGNYNWPTLRVTNPLTRQLQVLPVFNNGLHTHREWQHRPQFLMMVDEIANSYKVLIYAGLKTPPFPSEQLVVYDSKSMRWENVDLVHPPTHPPFGCWTEPFQLCAIYSTLCTRGRIYLSDIRKSTATDFVAGHVGSLVVRLFNP